jgi:hypothetical protein
MMYVVYNVHSTVIVKGAKGKECYKTLGAAKAALTRHLTNLEYQCRASGVAMPDPADYAIADARTFYKEIEKELDKKTIFGDPIKVKANTPRCCDPSTELYWSM